MTSFLILSGAALSAEKDAFVSLIPAADLSEHWLLVGTPPEVWWLKDGIGCAGEPRGNLRSKRSYKNYVPRAERKFYENDSRCLTPGRRQH